MVELATVVSFYKTRKHHVVVLRIGEQTINLRTTIEKYLYARRNFWRAIPVRVTYRLDRIKGVRIIHVD